MMSRGGHIKGVGSDMVGGELGGPGSRTVVGTDAKTGRTPASLKREDAAEKGNAETAVRSSLLHVSRMQGDPSVPAFLTKTFDIVSDPSTDATIGWNERGDSFKVHDSVQLCEDILPSHFKHNNMASFVRQLNIYGFQKVNAAGTKNSFEFKHTHFRRGQRLNLCNISRKTGSKKAYPSGYDGEETHKLQLALTQLNQMKMQQSTYEDKMVNMMHQVDALVGDMADLKKQQLVLFKHMHTLVGMFDEKDRSLDLNEGKESHHGTRAAYGLDPNAVDQYSRSSAPIDQSLRHYAPVYNTRSPQAHTLRPRQPHQIGDPQTLAEGVVKATNPAHDYYDKQNAGHVGAPQPQPQPQVSHHSDDQQNVHTVFPKVESDGLYEPANMRMLQEHQDHQQQLHYQQRQQLQHTQQQQAYFPLHDNGPPLSAPHNPV